MDRDRVRYAPDGKHLVSGAADGSVFFIALTPSGYAPVGFMSAPPPAAAAAEGGASSKPPPSVTTLCWAGEVSVYVGYSDGTVAELTLPLDADTSETYLLPFEGKLYDPTPIVEYRRAVAKAEKAKAAPPAAAPAEEDPLVPPGAEEPEAEPEEEVSQRAPG